MFAKIRQDFRTIVIAMVVGAVAAGTPAVAAIVKHAAFADNSDKVDGIHASKTPKAGKLLPLNSKKKFAAGPTKVDLFKGAACTRDGQAGKIATSYEPLPKRADIGAEAADTYPTLQLDCLIVDELEPNDGLAHETELAGGPRSLNGQLSIRPATRIGIRTTSPISMPYISRLVIAL